MRKTKNDRESKQTTKSGRQEARSERIDEIQWGNYSDRQIHSSDVRKGNNDKERQNKEGTDVGRTKHDRKGKQSLRELTKCSGNTTSRDKCREVTLEREGTTDKTKNRKY